jgi:hypothetical protein
MEKLFETIEIIEPYPAVYIESLDLIVIADLHLGYESVATEEGMFIPKIQYKKIIADIDQICSKRKVKRILINGDVKHEFSETSYHEYKEVKSFFDFMIDRFKEIIVVKGNHDTFITRITRRYDTEVYDTYNEKSFCFVHGHKDMNIGKVKEKYIILGHEHPSLGLYSDMGVKEKVKCFLFGEIGDKCILVLPAFSYFAQGSDINLIEKKDLLSPILQNIDIDSLKAIGIVEGEKCLSFPEIKLLRGIYDS